MNRRDLFKQITGLAVASALPGYPLKDELAVRRPLPKLDDDQIDLILSDPSTRTLITPHILARELLFQMNLEASVRLAQRVRFANTVVREVVKIGDSVRIRGYQDTVMAYRKHVSTDFKPMDLTLSLDDYSDKFIRPVASAFINQMRCDQARALPGNKVIVCADLVLPEYMAFQARAAYQGMSVRVVKDYDIDADKEILRYDVLYGVTRKG